MSALPDLRGKDLSALTPKERYRILCGILPTVTLEELLEYRKMICTLVPQFRPSLGFDQRSPHHRYDLYTHVAHVVSLVPGDLTLRWAAPWPRPFSGRWGPRKSRSAGWASW